jgi:hypothetical protein
VKNRPDAGDSASGQWGLRYLNTSSTACQIDGIRQATKAILLDTSLFLDLAADRS